MKKENSQNHRLNSQNHGLNSQNHRLNGFKDYTEIESNQFKNQCNLRNQNKSVIQTESAEILNSILELI